MVAKRVSEIPFSGIRKFFELVEQSKGIVSLGVGEPDFNTPRPISDAGIRAIEAGYTSYTSNWGLLDLRAKIAEKLKVENGLHYSPENEVLITAGTSEALDLAFRALINPGDEVLVPEPSYVSYKPCVWFAYGTPVAVPMREENDFRVQEDDLRKKITKKTKAIIVASPNNPTGSVLTKKDLKAIAAVAQEHDLWVISDELYEYLIYDGEKHVSIGSFPGMRERTITINGFSKGHAFTGWRIGYAAGPAEVTELMMKIHQYTMLCAPTIAQHAALAAFNCKKEVKAMQEEYDRRRRLLVAGLNELPGVTCRMPKGAFYTFPNITGTGMDSETFAQRLVKEAQVAVVPGHTFGQTGEGHVRCSYSVSRDIITEALSRMQKFLAKKV
ncbi:Aromatic-amino-acid aminotransferase 2 [uncultured archaeon]|nr:Aromatic-amino-acid aminotransferase 2 [uncultured archaeon]